MTLVSQGTIHKGFRQLWMSLALGGFYDKELKVKSLEDLKIAWFNRPPPCDEDAALPPKWSRFQVGNGSGRYGIHGSGFWNAKSAEYAERAEQAIIHTLASYLQYSEEYLLELVSCCPAKSLVLGAGTRERKPWRYYSRVLISATCCTLIKPAIR